MRERSLWLFLLIGFCNTFLNMALMLFFYDMMHFGYWGSSFSAYVLTSISSFYFNRRFSFESKGKVWLDAFRFASVILICYLFAYSLAKPLVILFIQHSSSDILMKWCDQIALIFGNVIFSAFNYLGQRFFAFNSKENSSNNNYL